MGPPQIQTRITGEHARITADDRPTLSFKSVKKVADITELVYILRNVQGFDTNFFYAMIQWGGVCCFECYEAYMDMPTNGKKDEHICIQGLQLRNQFILGNKN